VILFKKKSPVATVLLANQLAYSQNAITFLGGKATGSGGAANYAVGQVFYSTNTSTTGAVSQGVQQAFDFQTLSNPELTTVKVTAVTYPNLTKDCLILKITDTTLHNLRYTFFDANGKAIASAVIAPFSSQIQMKHLYISAYA
jgi:hypothetical protein